MNTYLGILKSDLEASGGIHTAREITCQPDLWKKTWKLIKKESESAKEFLLPLMNDNSLQIILTGAGTSAFIGEVLCGDLQKSLGKPVRAVATTDIVSHPENYFIPHRTTLLVSFARSGNSPESVAAVNLTNQVCENVFHLIITCNKDGKIIHHTSRDNSFVFLLPQEADDKSLAMTGSFTSMLLAGLLLGPWWSIEQVEKQIQMMCSYGNHILDAYVHDLKKIAELDFKRAVFLGSGPHFGTAHESHLKLQELTDGRVICKYDSFLGFRHGPKVVINKSTLIVFLFSTNKYVQKYEIDLVKSINQGEQGLFRLGIMEESIPGLDMDLELNYGCSGSSLQEPLHCLCSVMPAQILGFFKSMHLGLKPDAPSESGTITRVVQGVDIHDYIKNRSRKLETSEEKV